MMMVGMLAATIALLGLAQMASARRTTDLAVFVLLAPASR